MRALAEQPWVTLPEWHLSLLRISNGAEGSVGSSYLGLWPAEEVIAHNSDYRVQEFHPGMLMFGSSMGGTAYAFDGRGRWSRGATTSVNRFSLAGT